jgi:predicted O-methyltransferase YrrM
MDVPDIAQYFPHLQERVMPHSLGQPVLSDWADMPDDHELKLYKNCGFLNRDEAAILYQCAKQVKGVWLDIGMHTGWTTLHMAHGGAAVVAIEPMFAHHYFAQRAKDNIIRSGCKGGVIVFDVTSRAYFEGIAGDGKMFDGVMIDGDHCWMNPLQDAVWSFKHLASTGVILLHDFIGGPVREATKYLMCEGMKCRVYCASSQLLAVCWRGDFTPPDYTPDPKIDWQTVLTPLAATKLVGFKDGKAIADPTGTQGVGDFYFELCS